MSWRPEGWKKYKSNIYTAHNTEAEVYEAGADAILKPIIKLLREEHKLNGPYYGAPFGELADKLEGKK